MNSPRASRAGIRGDDGDDVEDDEENEREDDDEGDDDGGDDDDGRGVSHSSSDVHRPCQRRSLSVSPPGEYENGNREKDARRM